MKFEESFKMHNIFLMEGALGERLKREYHITFDENVAMANLVYSPEGKAALTELWEQYIDIARRYNLPFLATTPTRRANKERIERAGRDKSILADNVDLLREIQNRSNIEMYVGGLMGCKGDAYTGEEALTEKEAHIFHGWQAKAFRDAGVDFLYAGIMPTLQETIGMAKALSDTLIPYIISFTIQRDGKLIDGTKISDAIETIDNTVVHKPLGYMTNCAHPAILLEALSQPFNRNNVVESRFLGIQANTSALSYSELDKAKDLKCSEPLDFAEEMLRLKDIMNLKIVGGCCGTDHRHIEAVARKI